MRLVFFIHCHSQSHFAFLGRLPQSTLIIQSNILQRPKAVYEILSTQRLHAIVLVDDDPALPIFFLNSRAQERHVPRIEPFSAPPKALMFTSERYRIADCST